MLTAHDITAAVVGVRIDLLTLAILAAVGLLGVVAIVTLLRRLFRRPTAVHDLSQPELKIDVARLREHGPSESTPRLECYGVPVRLAVLVLAPVGRGGTIPSAEQLLEVVDLIVPGLVDVISLHQPKVAFWPPQLSSQGFVHAFFANCSLPGDKGKGTPWCSVAGKFNAHGEQYLAGLVGCASSSNGLGQVGIAYDGQWNDVLRIKR